MSLGILFPGQGSQSIGMLKDLKSSFKVVSEIFEEASDYLSCDLWKITKNGPESKINDTEFTQPIMLCSAFSDWKIWNDEGGEKPIFLAGHSFGEYTALCASEAVKFKDAVKLVKKRAECMKAAGLIHSAYLSLRGHRRVVCSPVGVRTGSNSHQLNHIAI